MTISPTQALLAIRDKQLRQHPAAMVVWLAIFPALSAATPVAIKVRATADFCALDRKQVRRALLVLVRCGYVVCVLPATAGNPAEYVLGPAAIGAATGGVVPPVQAADRLPPVDRAA